MSMPYRPLELIHEGRRALVFRGERTEDGLPVIIKQVRGLHPGADQIARSRREHDILTAAAGPGVVRVLEHVIDEGSVWLVLEDFGGVSLRELYDGRRLDPLQAMDLCRQIATVLAELHARDIVHKNLNPATILYNPDSGVLKLIDFGIASIVAREVPQVRAGAPLDADLRYMAPEQTGRMNRVVDYRSDYYALGAVTYELLTGRPPFEHADPLDLIHAHIARQPTPPHSLDHGIPASLSQVITTLLAKRAEDRYQSVRGLVHDLDLARRTLEEDATDFAFVARTRDIERRFRIPEVLYGREVEIATLEAACQRVASGENETLLVSGQPGIGKTSLVNEVHRPVAALRANLISGKFDQVNRGVPYASLVQAFRQFTLFMLASSEVELDRWRATVSAAVGDQGAALTALIAELELVIGPQPALEDVSPSDAENRLRNVFLRFVRALASAQQPLVMFLDDLQWADLPSLRLLEALAVDPDATHILLVGAYRDNEVPPGSPLLRMMDTVRDEGARISTIQLGPLAQGHVRALLADALHRSPEEVQELAKVSLDKTYGNPFYLVRFLENLHSDGLIRLTDHGWAWDLPEIRRQSVTENVVAFMSRQLGRLPNDAQNALQRAACIGVAFGLHALAHVTGLSHRDTQQALVPALRRNLIYPLDTGYWHTDFTQGDVPDFRFAFAHDRIQQAAHDALSEEEARRTHLAAGRRLRDTLDERQRSRRLFEMVEHLNRGVQFVESQRERDELADLNLRAGRRALRSAAFAPAHRYLTIGVELTDETAWKRRYGPTLDLYVSAAEAAYLAGDDDGMAEYIQRVTEHATSQLDRMRAQEIRVYGLIARNDMVAAVDTALNLLEELGFDLPRDPAPADIEAKIGELLGALQTRDLEALTTLPDLEDPTVEAARKLLVGVSSAAYLVKPAVFPLLAFALVESTLKDGVSRESPYGFSVFALVLATVKLTDISYAQGQLAQRLLERWDDRALRVRPTHVLNSMVVFWKDPLEHTMPVLLRNYADGVDTGDLEYAYWSAHNYTFHAYYGGVPLDRFSADITGMMRAMRHHKQFAQWTVTKPFAQMARMLQGELHDPPSLDGPDFEEDSFFRTQVESGYRGAVFAGTTMRVIGRCMFRQYEAAAAYADLAWEYQDGAPATMHVPAMYFYRALSHLANAHDDKAIAIAEEILEHLEGWASHNPHNFSAWALGIQAELAAARGEVGTAVLRFDEAIAAARAANMNGDEAILNERAGQYHLGRSRTMGRAYLLEARSVYDRWGAKAKVAHLERQHPDLFAAAHTPGPSTEDIDLEALFRASQAVARELRLDDLLHRVLEVALQNAGATRGFLLTEHDGAWRIETSLNVNGDAVVPPLTPLTGCGELAGTVAQYVARTNEPLVLANAGADRRFKNDPWLTDAGPTSILCMPLENKGERKGLLYIENHLITGCFTPARLKTVQVLAAQAAISMANASLVDNLEATVARRTDALQSALAQTEAIVDNMVDGLVAIDAAGVVRAANPALSTLLSVPVTLVGRPAAGVLPEVLTELMRQSMAENDIVRIELALSDGRLGSAAASPIHTEHGIIGAVVLLRDITLEKEIDRMKSEFTSTVAHELRTPLTSVIGFVKLVQRTFDKHIDEALPDEKKVQRARGQVRDNLAIVVDEGERLTKLINDMLDLAKIESGHMDWQMEALPPERLVERASNACTGLFTGDAVPFVKDVEQSLPDVYGDADWLQQVLINLISNAAKFTERGEVTLAARTDDDGAVVFSVTDTGKGIAEADIARVFDKFQQADTGAGKKGTGLGLPICKEIVTAHGGEIWCTSELGKGATFAFRLRPHTP